MMSPAEKLKEFLNYEVLIRNCFYRYDSTHALLLQRIGVAYNKLTNFLKAAEYLQKAIKISDEGKTSVNLADNILNYFWLSAVYDSLNNFTKKNEAVDSCIEIGRRLNYPLDFGLIRSLFSKTEYFFDQGDYYRCIDYATRCETLAREYTNNFTDMSYIMAGRAFSESSLGWKVKALLTIKEYESAEKLLTNKVDEYRKTGLNNYLGTAFSQLAEVQLHKGNYEKALFFFNQALKYDKDAGYDFNCKQHLKDIGYNIYFKHFDKGDKAVIYYKKAFRYTNKDKDKNLADNFESLNIFTHIANVYVSKGIYDSAWRYFQLAFDEIKPGINETDILRSSPEEFIKHKKIFYLTDLLISKGDAFRKQYEYNKQKSAIEKAISIYRVADRLLDRIKTEHTELQSKLFWRNDTHRLYENAIKACYISNGISDAFYFFEKSRSVLLQDQLTEQHWMDETSILKQTQSKKMILQLEREFETTEQNSKRYSELKNERFSQKQQLARLQQQIKINNPLYYQNYLDTSLITLDEVKQKVLHDHQVLIELFAGDSAVYSLVITANNVHFNRIGKNHFDSLTGLFINYISNSSLQNKYFTEFVNTSSQLYQLIFQNKALPTGRIIISPDGQYFPFEALITSGANQQVRWFLEDHAVSYTYSARFLMNDFISGSATTGKNFMGIAPVNYPAAFSLASLPGSDRSLHKIAGYFDNAVSQVSSHASRNNFMRQFSQYRIIQLYTHAADSSSNNEPVIYFADSALYLSDLISEYKPLTRLIVLSACETGTGKNYQGEGVFSFNRGFAALGIPAAITNLWSVDNASTYLLTELFYKWLAKGLPTDVALQKAKLEFLKNASREKSMPCYWAGPVLVGKTDIIELNKPYPWKWIILFVIVACIVLWIVRKKSIFKKDKARTNNE
jgi:CHAT domain-containing protein